MPDDEELIFKVLELKTGPSRDRRLLEHVIRICEGHDNSSVTSVGTSLLLDVMLSKSIDLEQINRWIDVIAAALRAGAAANVKLKQN